MNQHPFWQTKFDVLLLLFAFVLVIVLNLHIMHHDTAKEYTTWGMALGNNIQGSLLTLLTGRLLQRTADGNGKIVSRVQETTTVRVAEPEKPKEPTP